MLNRRKAAIGYMTYVVGKQMLRIAVRRKARQMAERASVTSEEPRRRRRSVVGATVAAAVTAAGAVAVHRLRRNGAEGLDATP